MLAVWISWYTHNENRQEHNSDSTTGAEGLQLRISYKESKVRNTLYKINKSNITYWFDDLEMKLRRVKHWTQYNTTGRNIHLVSFGFNVKVWFHPLELRVKSVLYIIIVVLHGTFAKFNELFVWTARSLYCSHPSRLQKPAPGKFRERTVLAGE